MSQSISYNNKFFYQVSDGVTQQTIDQNNDQINHAISQVSAQIQQQKLAFANVLFRDDLVENCKKVFSQISWAKNLVVVGIGGSDLGARAIQMALESNPQMKVIFHGDSTDPDQIHQLLSKIDLHHTVFNIVSKSGKTIETLSSYLFAKQEIKKLIENWQKHFIFTTSIDAGLLYEESQKYQIEMLEIPNDLGGRFSVLSPVGLFPALAMGLDIDQLITGAKLILSNAEIAQQLAKDLYLLSVQGINLSVLMPYSIKLEEFARWYRQLFAESLGKDNQGILPIQARGPADQHSQLQFYAQGPLLASILFLQVANFSSDFSLEEVDINEFSYLSGKKFSQIVHIEAEATMESLAKIGRPVSSLIIEKLDATNLGQLFMIFELAVVFLSAMFEINPFDQPGVEDSKNLIREKLNH